MPESIIKNKATFTGLYGVDDCPIEFKSNEVSTTVIKGLTATKVADKKCWVDGYLTYTVTITNNTGAEVTGGVMLDYLDPAIVALDTEHGVLLNGTATTLYTFASNSLSVTLPTLNDGDSVVVSFRVSQV